MNFDDVIQMRELSGPFAGILFLGIWFFINTWQLWLGISIGIVLGARSKKAQNKKTGEMKNAL